jgi:nanoRNase/pAp phosphatase (c-di-AMP/oligoRNAs hydrolase)
MALNNVYDMKRAQEALDEILGVCRRNGRILVLTQNNPDPDALASAAAFKELISERLHKRVEIGYGGVCGRAENRAMIDILRIGAKQMTTERIAGFNTVCLVDTQPGAGNNVIAADQPVDIIIDHHPLRRRPRNHARFRDIRDNYGATATILYEYLLAAELNVTGNLATALFYGIQSDTQDLGREAGPADVSAFQELFQAADKKKLSRIRRAPVPPSYFHMLYQSIETCEIVARTAVSMIRFCSAPDMIAEVADLMSRLRGVRSSVCYGLCQGRIYISVRTADARCNAGHRMKRVVRRLGTGGGHRTMAGGQVLFEGDPERRLALVRARILEVFAPRATPTALIQKDEGAREESERRCC